MLAFLEFCEFYVYKICQIALKMSPIVRKSIFPCDNEIELSEAPNVSDIAHFSVAGNNGSETELI
jgi:hypothetical protein